MSQNKLNRNVWFTSDTHYNHKNICRGISTWANKETTTRDFLTLEKMNHAMINSINSFVMPDDILYHLGDWSFGGIESIWQFRQRINCKNIHLILGNHDEHIKKNKILPNCHNPFIDVEDTPKSLYYREVPAKELFTTVQNYLELKIDKQVIVLSHFPIQEWYEMDRNSIHLHGHCHHKLDSDDLNLYYKRMDVGIDWEEFRPYSLEEIIQIMTKRKIKQHNS